uniref:DNA damage-binding protein 1 n=1 Tax=Heterorhabditis bacteriophora TaxID=37862 RepID=A0A1I7WW91_HETBA
MVSRQIIKSFRRLGWNKAYSEFFVYGVSIPMHIDDDAESAVGDHAVRQAFCEKRIAMAVFEIQPVRFKGMVQFDKKKFSNAYGAVLENDVLVTFCNSPHRVIIYSFDEIYKQNCIQTYEPLELSDGKQVLPFNIEVTSQITKLFELKGNYCSVYFGGSLRYILCEPTSQRESYVLRDLRDAQVTFILHVIQFRVRVMSMSYDGDRMLHLLVCYDIANLGGIMYSGAEPDSEWVSLMFSLDSGTGRIVNITPMQAHGAELFTDQFTIDVEDDMMASTSYDGKNTTIEIYRLVETDADKWQSEVSKRSPKKFVRSAMSRKERRKRKGEVTNSHSPDGGRSVIPR